MVAQMILEPQVEEGRQEVYDEIELALSVSIVSCALRLSRCHITMGWSVDIPHTSPLVMSFWKVTPQALLNTRSQGLLPVRGSSSS
jgi:hypothetical protein